MKVQVIKRDGEPEYAVLPWADYLALLQAAGHAAQVPVAAADTVKPALSELARLREEKGLSLQELARSVGISPHYLGMIESAERQPDAAIKRALAWALGVAGWEEKF
ncbi:helix-turn-helix transcriptional regulator [Pseudomonas sp. sp1636]|uniref:helix-turn-helix domain-containing protein n=1 Tax=Pseudomonas sp. sp1636 TaxID=3036707 RepID=UPI0025A6628A|nr:helix-turn-helix transcriptional regulator [Pseudomonas sp. sp1636]MDM8347782.1 helix-turn-helix transcriptional regulator [Pseudomonas sp. sp1636]